MPLRSTIEKLDDATVTLETDEQSVERGPRTIETRLLFSLPSMQMAKVDCPRVVEVPRVDRIGIQRHSRLH